MQTFKLTIEYDGTDFNGWQLQAKGERTVQGEIEAVLTRIFKKRIVVVGSGRTDSGVHARGQVAHIRIETDMHPDEIQRALNYNLPDDIVVVMAESATDHFHAQYHAKWKTYSYWILNRSYSSALERKRCYFYPRKLNVRLMRQAAQALVGRKDFVSFANSSRGKKDKNSVRTIKRLDIKKRGDFIVVTIESDGFLYKMVRNIVGTLLEVGAGRFSPESVAAMLEKKDRSAAGIAAAPQGLCLEEVRY